MRKSVLIVMLMFNVIMLLFPAKARYDYIETRDSLKEAIVDYMENYCEEIVEVTQMELNFIRVAAIPYAVPDWHATINPPISELKGKHFNGIFGFRGLSKCADENFYILDRDAKKFIKNDVFLWPPFHAEPAHYKYYEFSVVAGLFWFTVIVNFILLLIGTKNKKR